MTERYGYGDHDEPGGGQRPSGRGAVAERRAGTSEEAADREEEAAQAAVDDAFDGRDVEAGEEPPRSERERSGAFEPHPAPGAPTVATSIFDVGRDEAAVADGEEAAVTDREEAAAPDGEEAAVAAPDEGVVADREETAVAAPDEAVVADREEAAMAVPEEAPTADRDEAAVVEEAAPVPSVAEPAAPAGLLGSLDAEGIRNRFLDIQAGFVDEPRQAVQEAARFVDELVQQVTDALQAQRGQLQEPVEEGSTEDLRLALRAYRQFVDRLVGLAG
jgi:hypothetical protein